MKEKILKIASDLSYNDLTVEQAKEQLLALFGVNDDWKYVYELEPPSHCDILSKDPDGHIYLTNYRMAYNIFSCQDKRESSSQWQWKHV